MAVLDNRTGEWLAWEGSGNYFDAEHGGAIDGVASPRQPGSALKPFTYAAAFERGLDPAHVLADVPSQFPTAKAATGFVARIAQRMKTCSQRDLGSAVSQAVVHLGDASGASYALWRLENQVNQKQDLVPFWMGVVQVGSQVAQVNLTPVGQYDVDRPTFEALVVRARDRLHEVSQ